MNIYQPKMFKAKYSTLIYGKWLLQDVWCIAITCVSEQGRGI